VRFLSLRFRESIVLHRGAFLGKRQLCAKPGQQRWVALPLSQGRGGRAPQLSNRVRLGGQKWRGKRPVRSAARPPRYAPAYPQLFQPRLTVTRGGHIAAVCFRLRSPPDLYFATHRLNWAG
jgi:hypothetical protein